jgi:hypothetical protein
MPAELVTGTLSDFGWQNLAAFHPTLTFIPSNSAVSPDGRVFATKHRVAVLDPEDGSWKVGLTATDDLRPGGTHYRVAIRWLDDFGFDFPDYKLFVPKGGGQIGDLIQAPSNPGLVFVSLTEPKHPSRGDKWLHADVNDIEAGTGDLKEWS